ncbi:hypothetical protein NDI51_26315 [Microcoleus vaginatus GB1-A3]
MLDKAKHLISSTFQIAGVKTMLGNRAGITGKVSPIGCVTPTLRIH